MGSLTSFIAIQDGKTLREFKKRPFLARFGMGFLGGANLGTDFTVVEDTVADSVIIIVSSVGVVEETFEGAADIVIVGFNTAGLIPVSASTATNNSGGNVVAVAARE
jgi:hypothetical protein